MSKTKMEIRANIINDPDNAVNAFIQLQKEFIRLQKDKVELVELIKLIKKDLQMRAEFDTEDGGAIVNLSGFIYDRLNETLNSIGEDK